MMLDLYLGKVFKTIFAPTKWTITIKPRVQPKFKHNWYGRCTRSY